MENEVLRVHIEEATILRLITEFIKGQTGTEVDEININFKGTVGQDNTSQLVFGVGVDVIVPVKVD